MKGWGPKSSICPSKPGKSNSFLAGYFAGISWRYPKTLRKKKFVFNFRPLSEEISERVSERTPERTPCIINRKKVKVQFSFPKIICMISYLNLVLTLYGLILAPILNLFKLPFLVLGS